MQHRDIQQSELDELSWSDADREGSLSKVYAHSVDFAKDAEAWYAEKRGSKRL